ncbi:SMODS domain-containing nucleotidyltransferase [Herpetosiphon geysericola]|uniref:Nucleotidyltransferase n=1 Tax=Herpetosiphon geysericola TaxID=70996 RepID=A0A0P6XD11_9CHLR|nr:hypothetical protein [Herpetosiphon geysericola]KPL80617.1 hypothetical protein SE18_23665 [Herpetosiphon geysericola]
MSVLSHLDKLARDLNIAENEAFKINRSLTTLESRIDRYFVNDVKQRFRFGSSVRKTMLPRIADQTSDVDYMVVFDNSNNYKPQTFMTKLKNFATTYYGSSEIYQSSPTIVLELEHIKFELVPSYKSGIGFYIPAPRTAYTDWLYSDPTGFNADVDSANINTKFLMKPSIRLIKYWNARNGIYSSYELEKTVIGTQYSYCNNVKEYFFLAVNLLPTYGLTETNKRKVEGFKLKINEIKNNERNGLLLTAENEIKSLLPSIN